MSFRFLCRRPSFGMIAALVIAITVATSHSSHARQLDRRAESTNVPGTTAPTCP